MRLTVATLLCLALATLLVPTQAAAEPAADGSTPPAHAADGAVCTLTTENAPEGPEEIGLFPQDPLQMTCSLQVECSDGSVISCMGNTTCSTSPDGLCTVCDGVTTACCSVSTCCQECQFALDACTWECTSAPPPIPPGACRHCFDEYNACVANCTGGCS